MLHPLVEGIAVLDIAVCLRTTLKANVLSVKPQGQHSPASNTIQSTSPQATNQGPVPALKQRTEASNLHKISSKRNNIWALNPEAPD
uniref:Uncharacterized protein n=1 Tax=Chenopodium quinoa TaxID=63459 RepID=A0A803LI70_CHEQI